MKIIEKKVVEYVLVLSAKEAKWLKAYVQNYPFESDEDIESKTMRKDIFDALKNCGVE